MSAITKKRNHYIPITYLNKFFDDNKKLFIYKKGKQFYNNETTEEDRVFSVIGRDGLKGIMVKNGLYVSEGEFGEHNNIVEDFFNDEFESKFDKFITDLNDSEIKFLDILENYRDYIINLTASMMSRTLHNKLEMEELEKFELQISHNANNKEKLNEIVRKNNPELSHDKIIELSNNYSKSIKEGKFNIKYSKGLFVKKMMKNMEMKSSIISNMTIQILKNNTDFPFITSDNPVVYFVPQEKTNCYYAPKSLGGPHTELYFPLTKDLCLIMTRRKNIILDYELVNKGSIARGINYNMAHNSRNFIISSCRNTFLDNFIKEHIPYPFQIKYQ